MTPLPACGERALRRGRKASVARVRGRTRTSLILTRRLTRSLARLGLSRERGEAIGAHMTTAPFVSTEWLNERLADPNVVVIDGSWYLPPMNRDPDGWRQRPVRASHSRRRTLPVLKPWNSRPRNTIR